jgi:hypothetical protein
MRLTLYRKLTEFLGANLGAVSPPEGVAETP